MIIVRGLTKRFGDVVAVDHVDLQLPDDAKRVIIGPSGSGKTTLLRLIAGIDVPDAGEVWVDQTLVTGQDVMIPPFQRSIGFVFQRPALWPHMTLTQNVAFGLGHLNRAERRERVKKMLSCVELEALAHRYPHQVSAGEAKRAGLARTLAPEPKHLLMDEPVANLDPELRRRMLKLISKMVRVTQANLLYVCHDRQEANHLDASVLVMQDGRLLHETMRE